MIALDTNVLARILIRDDARQTSIAAQMIASERTFVPLSVLTETEWLLRRRLKWTREAVNAGLNGIARQPKLTCERGEAIFWVLDRHARGADFADMIHIAASYACVSFATFDRAVAGDAGADPPVPITTMR